MPVIEITKESFTIDFGHYTLKLKEFEITSKCLPDEIRYRANQALLNVNVACIDDDRYHQIRSTNGQVFLDIWHRLNPYWSSDNYISIALMPNEALQLADVYEEYLNKDPQKYVDVYNDRKTIGVPLTEEVVRQLLASVPEFAAVFSAHK